jgi:NAD(P)-dependent dehydrogenase (short-subunit alcohol dehydrogenase family)
MKIARLWIACIAAAREKFRRLHILINNAGTISRPITDAMSLDSWNRTMAVNLTVPCSS